MFVRQNQQPRMTDIGQRPSCLHVNTASSVRTKKRLRHDDLQFFNEHFSNERRLQDKTKEGGREKTYINRERQLVDSASYSHILRRESLHCEFHNAGTT